MISDNSRIAELARIAVFEEREMTADERNVLYRALGDKSKLALHGLVRFPHENYGQKLPDMLSRTDRVALKLLKGK